MTIFPRLAKRRGQDDGVLSGCEQQICAIGRGIMAARRPLMIDELSIGLAPAAVDLLTDALHGYFLDCGEVSAQGSSATLAADPRLFEAYLGA